MNKKQAKRTADKARATHTHTHRENESHCAMCRIFEFENNATGQQKLEMLTNVIDALSEKVVPLVKNFQQIEKHLKSILKAAENISKVQNCSVI